MILSRRIASTQKVSEQRISQAILGGYGLSHRGQGDGVDGRKPRIGRVVGVDPAPENVADRVHCSQQEQFEIERTLLAFEGNQGLHRGAVLGADALSQPIFFAVGFEALGHPEQAARQQIEDLWWMGQAG